MAENHVVKALVSEAPCSEDDQNLENLKHPGNSLPSSGLHLKSNSQFISQFYISVCFDFGKVREELPPLLTKWTPGDDHSAQHSGDTEV